MTPSSPTPIYDLAIIGGGINGAGIAADAAGRGLSVLLCEQDDLASHTSSASSKLIHGGLRYLEHFEFRLVREALAEREVLLAKAPHIVRPLRFVLPHRPHLRPAWLLRAGLFLYDHLGKRERLPDSGTVRFGPESPLKPDIRRGFEYSDCWVDDARLVVLNAMAARERGAQILTRTRCIRAQRSGNQWLLELTSTLPGGDTATVSSTPPSAAHPQTVRARALVNATGPWVTQFFDHQLHTPPPHAIRLVQGSHIVVPRMYAGDHAFILQNSDRRIVFLIPYLDRYTLIGTTDREYEGDPASVTITDAEIDYLLAVVNDHFVQPLQRSDIVHSYAGVRALAEDEDDDPSAVTRDYTLVVTAPPNTAPLLSVFGGKLTTYRCLAEAALAELKPWFPQLGPPWTEAAPLPGGDAMIDPPALALALTARLDGLDSALATRWAATYGSRIWALLGAAHSVSDLGEHFGSGLYAAEVDYLCQAEWAMTTNDILWRRTKLGLGFPAEGVAQLARYLAGDAAVRETKR